MQFVNYFFDVQINRLCIYVKEKAEISYNL